MTEGEFISITWEGYACLPTLTQSTVAEPGILVGAGYFGWSRVIWSDPGILVGSGYFGRSRVFWSEPGMFVGSRVFWSEPGILVGAG